MKHQWKILLFSIFILGVLTYVNVSQTDKPWSDPTTLLLVLPAVALVVLSMMMGLTWDRMRGFAYVCLALLLCSEAFVISQTMERLLAKQAAQQNKVLTAQRSHAADVAALEAEITASEGVLSSPNERVEAAISGQAAAARAVTEQASLKGCRQNCRLLLQSNLDAARSELIKARELWALRKVELRKAIATNKTKLIALKKTKPATGSGSALADYLGMPADQMALILAILGSLAKNGVAAAGLYYFCHSAVAKPQRETVNVETLAVEPFIRKCLMRRRKPISVQQLDELYLAAAEAEKQASVEPQKFFEEVQRLITAGIIEGEQDNTGDVKVKLKTAA